MSEYEFGVYRNDQFYGHEFQLSEKDMDKVDTGLQYLGHLSNSRHKSAISRFKQKQKQKRAKVRKKFKETSIKAFQDQWRMVLSEQLRWFEHFKITGKRTPGIGIRDSIQRYRDSDTRFRVGQYNFYTYYLLHGNPPNNLDGNIHPTYYQSLNTDPTGTGSPRIPRRSVWTYDSNGNYLKESFEDLKPPITRNFKHTIMSCHFSNI